MPIRIACLLDAGTYKAGDPPPDGYVQWHKWADTQHKAGLRQKACGRCGRWKFPQELSAAIDRCVMQGRNGAVTVESPVCNKCASADAARAAGKESAMANEIIGNGRPCCCQHGGEGVRGWQP